MGNRRVLLKLSGEALIGSGQYGIDGTIVDHICSQIYQAQKEFSVEIGMVIGGGNIFRGLMAEKKGYNRITADHMGMLATIINSLALRDGLERHGVPARVLSAIPVHSVTEPVITRRAMKHLEKGRVVIFAGGTGNPYFSTDSAAALRAAEIQATVLYKATKVDGVYEADPIQYPHAKLFSELSYQDVIKNNLRVMDITAITLCKENKIPIRVFNLLTEGNLLKALSGENLGTIIGEKHD